MPAKPAPVMDLSKIDFEALKRLGARGTVQPSPNALQVVVGTEADQVAGEMKSALRADGVSRGVAVGAGGAAAAAVGTGGVAGGGGSAASGAGGWSAAASLLTALGGRSNIRTVATASTRLRINIADTSKVNEPAIAALGLRGVAFAAPGWVHIIVGPSAEAAGTSLCQLLS